MMKIPLFKIFNPGTIGKIVDEVYNTGMITEGEYSDEFEKQFAKFIEVDNSKVAIVNSGTSALSLAAHLCDIKPGDEIVTTAMSCIATSLPFYNLGAKLVFADIDIKTGNIDPNSIAKLINHNTKAVVVVHWAGTPCHLHAIHQICKAYPNVKIVEDAAHAIGAVYDDKYIGNSNSDYVCFSFQAIKHLSTVDGGAIVCKNIDDAKRVKKLRWFGLSRNYQSTPGFPLQSRWEQDITESGFKYHMNNINAAIGIEQLKYVKGNLAKYRAIADLYNRLINNSEYVQKLEYTPYNEPFTFYESANWIYSILVKNEKSFRIYMNSHGISTDPVHIRNDKYTVFKKFKQIDMPNLDSFSERLSHIPCGWWVSVEQALYIIAKVNSYHGE